jgi:HK97 family phage prohead protease
MEKYAKATATAVNAAGAGSFRGYAARFLNIDRQGDIILPGAFSNAIKSFMDDGGLVLADHQNKTSAVIGTLVDATEDKNGLIVDVSFSATKSGQEVRQLIKEKAVRKMSIAFMAKKPVRIPDAQIRELWAKYGYIPSDAQKQLARNGANLISEVAEVLEVSIVPIPANPGAEIIAVKSADGPEDSAPAPPTGDIAVAGQLLDFTHVVKRAELADQIISQHFANRR